MTFLRIAALAIAAAVFARAAPLAARDCSSVPDVNTGVRNQIYQVALSRGLTASSKCMLVMMITAITESNVNNLDCGDQDSLGVFQQRPSQGWGSPSQLQDVNYSTNKFLDVAIPICNSEPGADAGDIAQKVQNAQAGNRYTQNEAEGRQLIAEAEAAVGGGKSPAPAKPSPAKPAPQPSSGSSGGAVNVGASPSKPAPKATPKPSSPAPAPAAPKPSAPAGDDNEGDGDCSQLPEDCTHSYTPVPGDNCYKVSGRFGISLEEFYEMNPSIDALCHNLEITQAYCVARSGN